MELDTDSRCEILKEDDIRNDWGLINRNRLSSCT